MPNPRDFLPQPPDKGPPIPQGLAGAFREPTVVWTNFHGRHGWWTTMVEGQSLRIDYVAYDFSGQRKHYRITSRYSNEMFAHQFYSTLREAQTEAVRMLKDHLAIRRSQGYKGGKQIGCQGLEKS